MADVSSQPLKNLAPPPSNADMPTKWAYLKEGLDRIFISPQLDLSYVDYQWMYTTAYNYSTSSRCGPSGKPPAPELYDNITAYLSTYVEQLRKSTDLLQDDALLRYYAQQWDRYIASAHYVNRIFAYLNQNWVEAERKKTEGRKDVYPIYTLALVQWKTVVLYHVQSSELKLTTALLNSIERERNGETVDGDLVKKVVGSFVSLGLDQRDLSKVSYEVYKEHFEQPFIEATVKYYRQKSEGVMVDAKNDVPEYLKRVEEWLHEEGNRGEQYLDPVSRQKFITKCKDVLIRERDLDDVYSGVAKPGVVLEELEEEASTEVKV